MGTAEGSCAVDGARGTVTAVSSNGEYAFTKPNRDSITLLPG
ncbi:MOSC domain-containing protein, partial [Streptomyces xanthochromogenes]